MNEVNIPVQVCPEEVNRIICNEVQRTIENIIESRRTNRKTFFIVYVFVRNFTVKKCNIQK